MSARIGRLRSGDAILSRKGVLDEFITVKGVYTKAAICQPFLDRFV